MKRFLFLLLPLLFASCSEESTGPETPTPLRPVSAGEAATLRSSATFGLSLFRGLASDTPDQNVILSPLSVSMALGMAANGAAGDTWLAMRDVLGYGGLDRSEVNRAYRGLLDLLGGMDPKVRLDIANSIWSREGFPLLQSFIDTNRQYLDAEVRALDFSRADAADVINAWVSGKTQGNIPSIVDGPIPELVMMYLINAVYFKGSWSERFDPALTRDDTFSAPGGATLPVRMMTRGGSMRYHQDAIAEIADLPYGWDRYAMAVLLPRPNVSLAQLREAMDADRWTAWLGALEKTEMDIQLPRFTLAYETRLVDVLSRMGMGIAFDANRADFTGINEAGDLHISDVRHKTFVKVDEEGTEAAAVTSVEIGTTSVPPVMRVDRPFLFVIHERHTGAILFIGQVTRPQD